MLFDGNFISIKQHGNHSQGQFDVEPRFYANKNGEIDFLIQNGMEIIPVEVKAGEEKMLPVSRCM